MKRIHYNVSGLNGSEFKTRLKNSLDKLEGVQMTAIDIGRGTVEVGYKSPADEGLIRGCIEKTGLIIL